MAPIREKIAARDAQARRSLERNERLAEAALNLPLQSMRVATEMVQAEHRAQNDAKIAGINAFQQRKATVEASRETNRQWINFLKDPKVQIGAVGVAAGIIASWHGMKLGAKLILDTYEIPDLADPKNTSLISLPKKAYNWVTGNKPPTVKLTDAIFAPDLAKQISEINDSLKYTVANGGFLTNMLLWGPPGNG